MRGWGELSRHPTHIPRDDGRPDPDGAVRFAVHVPPVWTVSGGEPGQRKQRMAAAR